MKNYIHQHDINGCGIAAIANLLQTTYEEVKQEFETKFYPITRGVKVTDITRFLKLKGLDYMVKHINEKKVSDSDGVEMAKELNSIVLIRRNAKYPIGHYLLRVKDGWIDPWLNLPSINQVHAGLRNELPNPTMLYFRNWGYLGEKYGIKQEKAKLDGIPTNVFKGLKLRK